jgi:hypothetical protein
VTNAADPLTPSPTTLKGAVTEELPDTSMVWRRCISTSLTCIILGMVFFNTQKLTDQGKLHQVINYLIYYAAFLSALYFTGASANDIMRLVTALRTKRTILSNGTDNQQVTPSGT